VTYPGNGDTYLYRQDGAPYELIRQTKSAGACGAATCRYWYLLDGRRSVVGLVDKTGNVVDRYHYDVWGAPSIDAEAVKQPLLYAGYWYDRELHAPNAATGWYWLGVRPYDPGLRRFLQPDPTGIDGIRSYVYAGDDPVDAFDATGEDCGWFFVGGLICGAGDLLRGAYNFVAGDDLKTLGDAHAKGIDKFLAVVDLASNALVLVPILGEGVEAARLAAKVALKAAAKLEVRQVTFDEAVQISKKLARKGEEDTTSCVTKCFPAGTLVATPKGEVVIERLRVGDLVLAEDPKTGTVEAERVEAVIQDPAASFMAIDLGDGSSVRVTANHPFWVDGGRQGLVHSGWFRADQLLAGDRLRMADGRYVGVARVRSHAGQAVAYTLTVALDHTYFVGSARVLVHNCAAKTGGGDGAFGLRACLLTQM